MLAPTRTSRAVERERQIERLDQRVRERRDVGAAADALHQHCELVPTEARYGIRRARGPDDAVRHRLQQPVARIVTQRVVDVLEVVEIEEHHRHRAAVALCQRERVLHAIAEQVAVGEQRQRIVEGELPQLLLERFALADVAEVERQTLHRRIARQVAADALDHAARRAALDAQLDRPDGAAGAQRHLAEKRPQLVGILAPPQPRQRLARDLLGLEPESALERRGGEAHHTLHGHDHDEIGGVGDQRGVALLDQARGVALARQRVAAQQYALAHHEQQRQREYDHGHGRHGSSDVAAAQVHRHQERCEHGGVGQ